MALLCQTCLEPAMVSPCPVAGGTLVSPTGGSEGEARSSHWSALGSCRCSCWRRTRRQVTGIVNTSANPSRPRYIMYLAQSPHIAVLTSLLLHRWQRLTPERKKERAKEWKEQWSSAWITPLLVRGLLLEFLLLWFYQMLRLLHWAMISWATSSNSTLSRSRTSFLNSLNLSPKGEMQINIHFLFLFQFT